MIRVAGNDADVNELLLLLLLLALWPTPLLLD
jgi:hypothetical protein